jgi:hypothetical protein
MQGQTHGSRLPHLWSIVAAASVVSCGTDPDLQRLPDGQYETEYDPPLLTRSTPGCDRMLSRAFLVISARGTFELSINVIDDCSRGGQGFSYFGILRSGGYYLDGSGLTFTPNAGAPTFAGVLDGQYIRMVLPSALELAASDLEVRVGPRTTF